MLENFSPRVLGNFGLDWEQIQAINPRCLLVRMPAFGLSGPWRDNVGFAQTMEQVTGMAWITGHRDDQPRIQQGPSDPERRDARGVRADRRVGRAGSDRAREPARGHDGRRRAERGRASWCSRRRRTATCSSATATAARTSRRRACTAGRDDETWLAISVDHRRASGAGLVDGPGRAGVGDRSRARDATPAGGRATTSSTSGSAAWSARRDDVDAAAELLVAHGVPAAVGRDPRAMYDHPQLQARGYYEDDRPPGGGRDGDAHVAVPLRVRRPVAAHAGADARPAQPRDPGRRPRARRGRPTSDSSTPRSSATARSACDPATPNMCRSAVAASIGRG